MLAVALRLTWNRFYEIILRMTKQQLKFNWISDAVCLHIVKFSIVVFKKKFLMDYKDYKVIVTVKQF